MGRLPFSPQKIVKCDAADGGYFVISPQKNSNASFSPFKNSTLSPFKQINQSPSKGALDDWDRDFITSFEENLFGMHDISDLSDSVLGELMKSPQGKVLLQKRNSPVRINESNAARQLITSPQHRTVTNSVIVDVNKSGATAKRTVVEIKDEPIQLYTVIKEEQMNETGLSSEHNYHAGHGSVLSATDPDKMNATPIKPSMMFDGKTAPKRNLAFRDHNYEPVTSTLPNLSLQADTVTQERDNNLPSIEVSFHLWPAKDRLKFAREHFKQILDKTVKDKIEKFRASQAALNQDQTRAELKIKFSSKHKTSKHKAGKFSRKAGKKDRYPQIKKALSKPAVAQSSIGHSVISHGKREPSYDPGWYPDDDSDDDTGSWHGPVPFQRHLSLGFHDDDNDDENVYIDVDLSSEDEYYPRVGAKRKKKMGKGLGKKKRKH